MDFIASCYAELLYLLQFHFIGKHFILLKKKPQTSHFLSKTAILPAETLNKTAVAVFKNSFSQNTF